jgi:hypothetical protein
MMWLVVLAAFVNAFAYAHAVANPMLADDNWTFVDTFLREALEGRLDFGDFLVKRAGVDHGQPLNKLSLLLNSRFFDLDFSIEALFGLVFAALGFLAIHRMATSDAGSSRRNVAFHAAMAAIAAVYVSLNNSGVFTFSLVTLGYVLYLLAFVAFHEAWKALLGGPRWRYAVAIMAYAVAGDTSGILTGVALAMALAWFGWRLGHSRRAWQLIAITAGAVLASQLVYAAFGVVRGSTQAVFNAPPAVHVTGLLSQAGDAWRWVVVPLASGIAHARQLQFHFPDSWQWVQVTLGLVLAGLHLWFWHAAWRAQPRAARFLAVCLMLSCYAYVAGVVWGRVFVRGSAFLDQPRYVLFYQLHVVALLLMAAARQLDAPPPLPAARARVAAAACLLLLAQVPASLLGWARVDVLDAVYRRAAMEYGQVARQPDALPPCAHWRNFCRMSQEERVRTVELLRRHRLNLFSPRFARAHPELVQAAGPLSD